MVVQSPEDFEITRGLGLSLHGVPAGYRRRAQRMQPDDRVLYYVARMRKWTATAIITSRCFQDHKPVWKPNVYGEQYPFRVRLTPELVLEAEDYIDAMFLAPSLEYVKRWAPEDWPLAFQDKLHLLPQRDYRLIEGEMKRNLSKRRRPVPAMRAEELEGQPPVQAEGGAAEEKKPPADPPRQPATEGS